MNNDYINSGEGEYQIVETILKIKYHKRRKWPLTFLSWYSHLELTSELCKLVLLIWNLGTSWDLTDAI
jgi:hypothetical protein